MQVPWEVEESQRFDKKRLLFFNVGKSDPLQTVARIPARSYYAGETIKLELDVTNRSDQTVKKFTVKLIRVRSEFKIFRLSLTKMYRNPIRHRKPCLPPANVYCLSQLYFLCGLQLGLLNIDYLGTK